MKRKSVETAVGIFILVGILCVSYLAVRLGRMEWFGQGYYTINAVFTSISGLKTGAAVEIAGVEVGQVERISLDQNSMTASVELKIQNSVKLDEDTNAAVKTSGLIGDRYISLTPGQSEEALKPGSTIMDTQGAVNIEDLISKFAFGKV